MRFGGNKFSISKGFWRESLESDQIYSCFNPNACHGGFKPRNKHPIECAKAYEGILCHHCIHEPKDGERRYTRIGDHECLQCQDPYLNGVKIIFTMLLMLAFIGALIYFNIRKKKESGTSIVGKIFMNYLHMVSTSFSFNIAFPISL